MASPIHAEVTRPLRSDAPTSAPLSEQAPGGQFSLRVLPRRRRWPAFVAGFIGFLLLAAMFGAAIFHTQLAERQLEIDALENRVAEERQRFDDLRLERAQLRSPVRLAAEADRLGMVLAPQSRYLEIDQWAFARQVAAAGPIGDGVGQIIVDTGPLDQFRDVKSLSVGQP